MVGGSYNGSTLVSKTNCEGSTPSPPAKSGGFYIASADRQNRLRGFDSYRPCHVVRERRGLPRHFLSSYRDGLRQFQVPDLDAKLDRRCLCQYKNNRFMRLFLVM